ncbi:MAG: DUF58 domain-containing protein [Planctomycetaceae bacterium]|nr:DUF58 domain-containing protein [Planctomycetaceae bacterium]
MALFNSDFLNRLEYLSLVSRKVFPGQLMAKRRTNRIGSGIEFADHRQYVPGDDFRYLDWNLYARYNDLLVKRFHEEEDLHVYLLVDCSRSMDCGLPSKFDLARQTAAALAYVALSDLDRVSILAFADGVLKSFPLTRGKGRILTLMRFLEDLRPAAGVTDLQQVTRQFVLRSPARGLVVVLSDFFDPQGFEAGIDVLRYNQFEPYLVQIHAAEEASPQLLGEVELADSETGALRKVTVTERQVKMYQDRFQQFLKRLRAYATSNGMGCTVAATSTTFIQLVQKMIAASVR